MERVKSSFHSGLTSFFITWVFNFCKKNSIQTSKMLKNDSKNNYTKWNLKNGSFLFPFLVKKFMFKLQNPSQIDACTRNTPPIMIYKRQLRYGLLFILTLKKGQFPVHKIPRFARVGKSRLSYAIFPAFCRKAVSNARTYDIPV